MIKIDHDFSHDWANYSAMPKLQENHCKCYHINKLIFVLESSAVYLNTFNNCNFSSHENIFWTKRTILNSICSVTLNSHPDGWRVVECALTINTTTKPSIIINCLDNSRVVPLTMRIEMTFFCKSLHSNHSISTNLFNACQYGCG